jgi:hypothetical protein
MYLWNMKKGKVKWCLKQKKGIILKVPNEVLTKAYLEEADKTLENVFSTSGKWKLITGYYACYNALYAILMKCGIVCEIHDCSIELMPVLGFEEPNIEYLKVLKENRIKAQYYLKDLRLEDESGVKNFILSCKMLLNNLSSSQIEHIRKQIKEIY